MSDKRSEEWTYAGRRADDDGKPYHVWYDESGKELQFGKLKGTVVGGRYEVTAERKENGRVSASPDVSYLFERTHGQREGEWRLEDRAAMAAIERKRVEKRAAKDEEALDDLTLREIREMMRRRLSHQRAGLLAAIFLYLNR